MSGEDLRSEARAIAGSVRALLEQLRDTGADALPSDPTPRTPPKPACDLAPQHEPARPPQRAEPRRAETPFAPREPAPPRAVPATSLPVVGVHRPVVTLDAPVDALAGRARLDELAGVVRECRACPLHTGRTQTVFARGNPETDLMFVGEGPGAEEDAQGYPFVGKAGQLLDRMIAAMGYRPDDVYIANVVKCRPPGNRKPEPSEMETCEGYLHEQIAIVRPKAIVALGATACEGLLKVGGITKLRGKWRLYRGAIPVMPTFHPAYLLRTPSAKREVWEDLQQVMAKLGKSPPSKGGA